MKPKKKCIIFERNGKLIEYFPYLYKVKNKNLILWI